MVPDGNWIAFLDEDDYYIVRPSGTERKLFLHTLKPMTGLFGSPDGRFVAYGLCCKYKWADADRYWRFYVRRLRDDAEDWVADIGDIPLGRDVHWVPAPEGGKASERQPSIGRLYGLGDPPES